MNNRNSMKEVVTNTALRSHRHGKCSLLREVAQGEVLAPGLQNTCPKTKN